MRQPLIQHLYRFVIEHATACTVNSRFTERVLTQTYGYRGRVLRVWPGVDLSGFTTGDRQAARRQLGLKGNPLILTVARLMRRKGHELVLESLPRLRGRFPDLRYLIVGEGPERSHLEALIRKRGLQDEVLMLGRLSLPDLIRAYQAADVFVHPNRQLENGDVEGFGIVFLEAAACGLPVIGGRSGGTVDAVDDGENGFLIDPTSSDELVQRISQLLLDPRLSERMGTNGRVWASRFDWSTAAALVWSFSHSEEALPTDPARTG